MVSLSQAGRAADGRAMRGRAAPLGPKARARRPAPGPSGGRLVAREAGPARKSVNATHSLSSALAGRIEWDREGVLGSGATGTSGSPAAAALIFEEEVRQSRNETTSRFEEEDAAAKQTVNRLITEAPDAYALCAVAKTHWRSFDATATTRAIAWLAKFSTIKDDREVVIDAEEETHRESLNAIAGDAVKRLRALVGKHAMEFSARDVVVLLGGFAQLGWDLVPALSDRVRVLVESGSGGLHLSKLSAQEIVCAVWALGSCAGGHGGRGARPSPSSFLSRKGLRRLEDTCLTHLTSGSLEAAQMVQIVWGFGQLNHKLAGQAWYGGIRENYDQDSLKALQPAEQALFAWSLGRVGLTNDKALGQLLLRAFKSTLKQYDLVSMNSILKCFHAMKIKVNSDLLEKCEVRCLQCMSKCSTGPISDFIYRCVKARHNVNVHTRVYIENTINSKMSDLGAKEMALLLWSFAKLGHKPKQTFLKRLESQFEVLEMQPQSLSLLIWAYAKLKLPVSKRFAEAHYFMVWKRLEEMNTQCLANIMWSYGRLGMDVPKDLFDCLMTHFRLRLSECNSQNISNVMVSCARLGKSPGAGLIEVVEVTSARKMHTFSSQGMANMLWSFVKLSHVPSEEFLLSFQKNFGATVHKASPQNVANVVWSFAQIQHTPYDSVMSAILDKVETKLDTFSEQDVATLLWGCGKLKYSINARLLRKFQSFCLKRSRRFSLHDISLSLWGFTQQQVDPRPEVTQAMYEMSVRHLDKSFHAEAFVHVVWSLSVRNAGGLNRGAILCHRYREQILESVHALSGYDASKLFCSMSFLDCMSPEICAKLMKIIAQRIHTYDSSQLQSILNASETLDLSSDTGCASEEDWFAFNQRIQSELAGAGRPKGGV